GEVELVRIRDAEGRIAAEGALPYPPGVLCVVPGEVWGGAVQRTFLDLKKGGNLFLGFSPGLRGFKGKPVGGGRKGWGSVAPKKVPKNRGMWWTKTSKTTFWLSLRAMNTRG
ncbi:hypothetical protein KCA24_23690, partial [Escherichia coli]|nr:hypothetical protein [Escherichia coli]